MLKAQQLKNYIPFGVILGSLALLVALLGPLKPVDEMITSYINHLPRNWKPAMEVISFAASAQAILAIVGIGFLINLAVRRKDRAMILLSSLAIVPVYALVKKLVHRPRPENSPVVQFGFNNDSFPSGHAAAATVVYLTLAYLLYKHLPPFWSRIFLCAVIILIMLVGISRIYLHDHHPTDVLGGWLMGGLGLLIVRQVANTVEGEKGSSATR